MSKYYVLDIIPCEALIALLVEGALLLRLSFIYSLNFKSHPILTAMVTNALLTSVSETCAQMLTSARERSRNLDVDKEARLEAIREQYDLPPQVGREMLKGADRPFDLERLARFICYGFLSAVLQFKWFEWLDDALPIAGRSALVKRLLADQLFWAPFSLFYFFLFMSLLEGNTFNDLKKRLKKQYMGALKAQYLIWPFVQFINFKFVPLMYQLPLVSSVSIGWNIYLSLILNRALQAGPYAFVGFF